LAWVWHGYPKALGFDMVAIPKALEVGMVIMKNITLKNAIEKK
jgi:hypothetical protein